MHFSAASTQRRSYRASELAAVMILKRGYEKCLPLLVLHLIQLALPLCGSEAQIPLCNLPMSHGNHCGIVVEQFYYDSAVAQCRGFLYYGCDGNENRFATKSACEEVCSPGRGEAAPLVCTCVCGGMSRWHTCVRNWCCNSVVVLLVIKLRVDSTFCVILCSSAMPTRVVSSCLSIKVISKCFVKTCSNALESPSLMISKHQEYPIVTNSMLFEKGAAWKYMATLLYVHATY